MVMSDYEYELCQVSIYCYCGGRDHGREILGALDLLLQRAAGPFRLRGVWPRKSKSFGIGRALAADRGCYFRASGGAHNPSLPTSTCYSLEYETTFECFCGRWGALSDLAATCGRGLNSEGAGAVFEAGLHGQPNIPQFFRLFD